MFCITFNSSKLYPRPRAKVFDAAAGKLVTEPDEIIDQRIDYRSMSIESQIENGTINKGADFSNYGVNPLDMSDAISNSFNDFNEQLDQKENAEKEKQAFDEMVKNLGFEEPKLEDSKN